MTWLTDAPFSARLGVLVALMIVGAAVEVAVRGREATRPREYAFLLAAGAIGAVFAMCVDQVTSRMSPEYFVVGKGLDEGPTFARAVIELSLQAGLVAGLVLGGVLLLANQARPGRPALRLPALLARAALPLGAALVVAPLGALVGGVLLPGGTRAELARLLEAEPLERFMCVWGVHLGLYVGAVMGVIGAVVDVRRRRRTIVAVACLLVAVGLDGCAAQGAAVDDLRGRAEAGDVGAMRALAHKHLGCSSRGPSAVDRARAIEWLRRASERGSTRAMNDLAYWLVDAEQREEADRWMRRSIAAGDAQGFSAATRLLEEGDDAAARMATEWLRLAAATGNEDVRAHFDDALRHHPELRRVEDEPFLTTTSPVMPPTPTARVAEWNPVLPAATDRLAAGVRHFEEGRPDDARAGALAALRVRRDHAHALVLLAACDLSRARETPTLGWAHLVRARVSLDAALEAAPTDASVWAALATVYTWEALGGSEWAGDAVSAAATAASFDAAHAALATRIRARLGGAPCDLREQIASSLMRRSRTRPTFEERKADLDLALSLDPDHRWALGARGYLRAAYGDLEGGLRDLEAWGHAAEMRLALRARLGDLAGVEAELEKPSLLRAVVRLLLNRREDALADLEHAGAHLWLAGLGADPRRHWHDVCRAPADRPTVDGDVLAARLHLGRSDPDELRSWADSLPADDQRSRRRLAAHLHLGLHADRRGDRAAARLAYSECVADCTSDGSLDSSPEHVWAEARLRSLE